MPCCGTGNLRGFWRQELGERFFERLRALVPYTWIVDPAPLPPQGALPELNLTDWTQLKALSQRERELILKVSGFSDKAWGARGVHLGSDLSTADWAAAVDEALRSFPTSPYVLQRYHHPALFEAEWYDFARKPGRRPCRAGSGSVHTILSPAKATPPAPTCAGVLATICPADKKIIHGMSTAILALRCVSI